MTSLKRLLFFLLTYVFSIYTYATNSSDPASHPNTLYDSPGFFRFSFDNLSMPNHIQDMGLLGLNYFGELPYHLYAGVAAYGALTGTQGGLFTLGVAGGWHHQLVGNWWLDTGLFLGGGGGRSSLVGGGLMIRPNIGLSYDLRLIKLGVQYDYISFPDGKIHSQQIGLHVDIPTEFYFLPPRSALVDLNKFYLCNGKYLALNRNNFGIFLQAYFQRAGTLNTNNKIQDGTIKLVGAEIDHFVSNRTFWWIKTSGAFSGIPNGYMDVLGGLGYSISLPYGFALIPQLGAGAGGGGVVDTNGGFLINSLLGLEIPILRNLAFRLSSGYLWAPQGQLSVVPLTGQLLYHLNFASGSDKSLTHLFRYEILGWRLQAFNQTYLHPQRSFKLNSSINLIGAQIDQLFTPFFFFVYQATAAYQGKYSGGYATGMIGPGLQSQPYYQLQPFGELLVGAGGGGNLALSGGSIIMPVLGLRYALTNEIGLQASIGQLMALQDSLNTPVINIGLTIRFDTLNQIV